MPVLHRNIELVTGDFQQLMLHGVMLDMNEQRCSFRYQRGNVTLVLVSGFESYG